MTADAKAEKNEETLQERWKRRFFWPVILAALASIPAAFLTMIDGRPAVAGTVINAISLFVFTAEAVVLLALAKDKLRWLREQWFLVAVVLLTIPAVLFALGPVQLLRFVRLVGALRIVRVGRIFKAGRILYGRSGLSGPVRAVIALGVTATAAAFVALVLADPTARSRQLVEGIFGDMWPIAVSVAMLLLGGSTFVVARDRDREKKKEEKRHSAE